MPKILKDGREMWAGGGNGYLMPPLIFRRSIRFLRVRRVLSKYLCFYSSRSSDMSSPPAPHTRKKEKKKKDIDNYLLIITY